MDTVMMKKVGFALIKLAIGKNNWQGYSWASLDMDLNKKNVNKTNNVLVALDKNSLPLRDKCQ